MPQRFIYFFGDSQADGGDHVKHLVGGKGASLAEMTKAGLNVPPGFTISAECCDLFYKSNRQWPDGLESEVHANRKRLERMAGRVLGRGGDPLLLAVRSGAAQSMPGMMDTILNVGLNPDCVRAMAERTESARAAWEAYRQFLAAFGHTVAGIDEAIYAVLLADLLREVGKHQERDLSSVEMERLCDLFRDAYHTHTGRAMPSDPWELLVQSIDAVFASWMSDRAVAYRQHHQIDGLLGTAVSVQMMCPARVSGVMFTVHPVDSRPQIVIESSHGLGEGVVLGKVTPDRFVLQRQNLHLIERNLSSSSASLTDAEVLELAHLGLRVEEHFQMPCDIEWGLSGSAFYLLQARAVKETASGGRQPPEGRTPAEDMTPHSGGLRPPLAAVAPLAEVEEVRQEEIAALRAKTEPRGTVWSRYNLAEVLPAPTPMTWAIVKRFMSGKGGFGRMYRDLGFDPDPALDEEGIFDLVCGRPYCNLSREPRMQYRSLPFEHSFAVLKANPRRALYPQASLNPARAGWRFWLFLPAIFFKLWRASVRLRKISREFLHEFRQEIVPAYVREVDAAAAQDLGRLDRHGLVKRLQYWMGRTLLDFARHSLKPTALAGVAMGNLERILAQRFVRRPEQTPVQRAQAALRELVMGLRPETETDLPEALRQLARSEMRRAEFLARFGHRGQEEMELAQPRWSEDPAAVDRLVAETRAALARETRAQPPVIASSAFAQVWDRIVSEARLTLPQQLALEEEVQVLHCYLGLRETAKHYFLKGYALIRRILTELDRRFELDGGIFFLTPEELPDLTKREMTAVIGERRRRRELALSLHVPQVLFSDDLEAIGRAVDSSACEVLQGVPLSAGVGEGHALVLERPTSATVPREPYILVCPSTDPAWVPLFVQAKGLVMETGGVLSHGAIVAREFGLPAVAGLPDVHRRLRTGQRLRVNGATGRVDVLA